VVEQGIWRIRKNQELRELYNFTDIVADIKRREWKGLEIYYEWIREGELRKYFRVNRREVEEGEDLVLDGWKM